EYEYHDQDADDDGDDRDRGGFCRGGDQDDDPGRVEQIGHGEREDGDLHRVLVFGRVAVAVPVARPEDHGDRDDEQEVRAGDRRGGGGEVQQRGQHAVS